MSNGNGTRKLTFTTLRVIKEVMESKSLTKSARKLNITQPAVSTHLRRFEECIGFAPLIRVGNEMIVVSKEAQRLLDDMISLEKQLLQIGRDAKIGKKVLGICQHWGMQVINDLDSSKYFFGNFSMIVDCSTKLNNSYIDGNIDIVIRGTSPSDDLSFYEVCPLSWAGNFTVEDKSVSRPVRVILGNPATPIGRTAREWLDSIGLPYLVVMECDNPKLLPDLCRHLDAITAVPTEFAQNGGFLFADAFGGRPEHFEITVGLFYNDRVVSFVDAEECFSKFTASVVGSIGDGGRIVR